MLNRLPLLYPSPPVYGEGDFYVNESYYVGLKPTASESRPSGVPSILVAGVVAGVFSG